MKFRLLAANWYEIDSGQRAYIESLGVKWTKSGNMAFDENNKDLVHSIELDSLEALMEFIEQIGCGCVVDADREITIYNYWLE